MNLGFASYPTGSTYIVGSGADKDIVVLFESAQEAADAKQGYLSAGWEQCGSDYGMDGDTFFSVRQGELNIIAVWDYSLFLRWCAFTELAKALNLTDKMERIELSRALVDDSPLAAQNITRYFPFWHKLFGTTSNYL